MNEYILCLSLSMWIADTSYALFSGDIPVAVFQLKNLKSCHMISCSITLSFDYVHFDKIYFLHDVICYIMSKELS